MNQPNNMTLEGTLQERESAAQQRSLSQTFAIPARWCVLLAVILAPWAFASVYSWAQLGIAIALLVGLGFWWFETAMNSRSTQIFPYISLLVLGGLLIGGLQLVPIPQGLADSLLGRQQEIYQTFVGESATLRYSVDPEGTWGQIFMLLIALSGLLLGARYFRSTQDLKILLTVCAANGVLLAFFGMIQKLTFRGSIYWTFPISSGLPFGPFINRNNGAGFLLMSLACCLGLLPIVMAHRKNDGPVPMVSKEMPFWRQFYFHWMYFLAELTATKIAVMLGCGVIAAGIVTSLSRGGTLALLASGIVTLALYGIARKPKNTSLIVIPALFLAGLLSIWIGFSDQLTFKETDLADLTASERRIQNWKDTYPAVSEMKLLGSGLGTYKSVHRLYNSANEFKLFEYAENQYFQALVEAGWPGLILFSAAWGLAIYYAAFLLFRGQSSTSIGVGSMGIFLLSSQMISSAFDFGLYVPANFLQMSVLVGFLGYQAHALAGRMKKKSWLRFEVPNYAVQISLLILFASVSLVALDNFRQSRLDSVMKLPVTQLDREFDLKTTDEKIAVVTRLAGKHPRVKALNYLGELWIHRARLTFMEELKNEDGFKNAVLLLDAEERLKFEQNVWNLTTLLRIQENLYSLKRDVSSYQAKRFANRAFIRDNLPIASRYLTYSKSISPLQPVAHLRIAQIESITGQGSQGTEEAQHAIQLAPSNVKFRMIASILFLQSGNAESSLPHLQRALELEPKSFPQVMELLRGATSRSMETVTDDQILDHVMPDNASMLYNLATKWLSANSPARTRALEKADLLLADALPTGSGELKLRVEVRLALDDQDGALGDLATILRSNPLDHKSQFKAARLRFERGELDLAFEEAEKLLRVVRKNRTYNKLYRQIETAIQQRELRERVN